MSKNRKKYAVNAFDELVNTLTTHMGKSNALSVLVKMINENDKEFDGLKEAFIHDMNKFLSHWFSLVFDTKSSSSSLRAKILTREFMETYYSNDFNRFISFMSNAPISEKINPYTGHFVTRDLTNYTLCVIKAVIQHTRCSLGYDANGTKYIN